VGDWRYLGSGYARLSDAAIAEQLARNAAIVRDIERQDRAEDRRWRELLNDFDAVIESEPEACIVS